YSLALRDSKFSYNIHKILLSITNALIKRDNDLACQLFSQHMASMLDIVDLLIDDNLNVLESFTSA
ncbi:MAG: GntR family transcriptional regulator, partial [Lachnoanaerobaculum saburreum]